MPALTLLLAALLSFPIAATSNGASSQQLTQEERVTLQGVTEVYVQMRRDSTERPEIDDRLAFCNLSATDLELSAARVLIDAGIRVVPQPSERSVTLFILVNPVVPAKDLCVTSLNVTAVTLGDVTKLKHNELATVRQMAVTLWERGLIYSAPRNEFADMVIGWVRTSTEQFATKVKLANVK